MIKLPIVRLSLFSACVALTACQSEKVSRESKSSQTEGYTIHTFKKIQLTENFWSEGANYGDFNHDGKMDIVSGPYWWEGPDFHIRHEYYPATKSFSRKGPDGSDEKIAGFEGALGNKNTY